MPNHRELQFTLLVFSFTDCSACLAICAWVSLGLWIALAAFEFWSSFGLVDVVKMALVQASMSKFLYEGRMRIEVFGALSDGFQGGCWVSASNAGFETVSGALNFNGNANQFGIGTESSGDNSVFVGTMKDVQPALSSDSDLQELNPVIASPMIKAARRRRKSYEFNTGIKDEHVLVQYDGLLDACTLGIRTSLFKL